MELKRQTDQDISIHIVSNVNAQQRQVEELLSRQHYSSKKQKGRRGYARANLDLGLTIANANASTSNAYQKGSSKHDFLTSLQERYEKEKLQQRPHLQSRQQQEGDTAKDDQQTQRAIAEAEAYALSRKTNTLNTLHDDRTTGDDSDDDNGEHDEKENMDISGRSMFGFSTTRNKSTQNMMKKVVQHDNSLGKSNSNNQVVETQLKKRGRPRKQVNNVETDIKKRGRKQNITVDVEENEDKQQRMERKRQLGKAIQHETKKDDNDEDEDEDDSEQSSEDDDDIDVQQQQQTSLVDEAAGYERYFQDLHGSSKTSNNTMSQLPALEPQQFQTILETAPTKHGQERLKLTAHHEQHFPQWLFELRSGFNLVFYGYGSKRQLINKFAMQVMTDGPLIVVNGFFPSITIKDIMTKILVGALEAATVPGTLQEQLAMVRGYFTDENRGYRQLYLVVHNMDGVNLRNENSQAALASLAETPNIHLVGSIDQINAGLLWDNVKSTRFNWIYHDATTFNNYLVETSFENTLLMGANENGGARGVQHVLASLTSNGRGIFRVLAEYQMLEMEVNNVDRGSEQVGLPYPQYFEKCREQFLVSTETGMRSQLTEFKDHKVMVTKRLLDGTELLYMPLDKSTLMAIVETMD
ncbi:unnamed protein product [Absidia cylindrospora]